jgi:hypothetical protein
MVYGSRFMGGPHRVMFSGIRSEPVFWLIFNRLNDLNLSDMETGIKAFRRDKLMTLRLTADRFTFEPEIIVKPHESAGESSKFLFPTLDVLMREGKK